MEVLCAAVQRCGAHAFPACDAPRCVPRGNWDPSPEISKRPKSRPENELGHLVFPTQDIQQLRSLPFHVRKHLWGQGTRLTPVVTT